EVLARHAESDDTPGGNAAHVVDDRLDVLRIDVLAADDDQVLLTAGDEELAAGEVAEVAGAVPAVDERGRSRFGVAVAAVPEARRGEQDLALDALPEVAPGVTDDAHVGLGQRRSGADAHAAERIAPQQRPTETAARCRERVLGERVARGQRVGRDAI